MCREPDPSEEALIAAMHECGRHAKHDEKQRFWFSSVFAAILGGSLIVIDSNALTNSETVTVLSHEFPLDPVVFIVFLLFLTASGIMVTLKSGIALYYHAAEAQVIANRLGLEYEIGAFGTPLFSGTDTKANTSIVMSIGPWFLFVYLVTLSALLSWATYIISDGVFTASGVGLISMLISAFAIVNYTKWKFGVIDDYMDRLEERANRRQKGLEEYVN